jgi:hypothetical protein
VAPGGGDSYSFALNVNGVDSLAMTIVGAATEGSNMTATKTVAAGDLVYIATAGSAGLAVREMWYCLVFEPAVDGVQPFLSYCVADHDVAHVHAGISGGVGVAASISTYSVVPFPGKFKFFYARDNNENVPAGETITCTFRLNGAPTAMVLTLTVGERLESDLATEVACVAGDYVDWEVACVTGHPVMMLSCCFIPDDPRLWFMTRPLGNTNLTAGAIAYSPPTLGQTHAGNYWLANEVGPPIPLTPVPAGVAITGIAVGLSAAPGGVTSRTFTLRLNQVDTAIAVTVAGANTFGVMTTGFVEPNDFDMLSLSNILTGGAAASRGAISIFGATSTVTVTAVVPASGERGTP